LFKELLNMVFALAFRDGDALPCREIIQFLHQPTGPADFEILNTLRISYPNDGIDRPLPHETIGWKNIAHHLARSGFRDQSCTDSWSIAFVSHQLDTNVVAVRIAI
jgi:hypothetical protein